MQNLHRLISGLGSTSLGKSTTTTTARLLKENVKSSLVFDSGTVLKHAQGALLTNLREFSAKSGGFDGADDKNEWDKSVSESFSGTTSDNLGWDTVSSWSTGLTKDHFDGEAVGRKTSEVGEGDSPKSPQSLSESEFSRLDEILRGLEAVSRENKEFIDNLDQKMAEISKLIEQGREPGIRGSYLKNSEKNEMYRLHKENPEVYTVEKLAKDYRIMRQRVHAILWLKEMEEEEKDHPLDDAIEDLLDNFSEFFNYHDREFHVASLPYKPEFKVMPEGWDGKTKDLDEVHYEISKREDEILYRDFVKRLNFNKMKVAGKVFQHKYSRRRPADGWKFTVEKMGRKGKRRGGGAFRFVSLPDGSSRPLDEMEKLYAIRETPTNQRKILP